MTYEVPFGTVAQKINVFIVANTSGSTSPLNETGQIFPAGTTAG